MVSTPTAWEPLWELDPPAQPILQMMTDWPVPDSGIPGPQYGHQEMTMVVSVQPLNLGVNCIKLVITDRALYEHKQKEESAKNSWFPSYVSKPVHTQKCVTSDK